MNALRTLVVEDDAIIGGLLAETLEGLGHMVCAVESNVANAAAAASRWRPDLMIVDVGLGEATVLTLSSFKSPSVYRIWSKRFKGRSQRRRLVTASRSKAKRQG
jgi:DNA-binding NtrC family response regulator